MHCLQSSLNNTGAAQLGGVASWLAGLKNFWVVGGVGGRSRKSPPEAQPKPKPLDSKAAHLPEMTIDQPKQAIHRQQGTPRILL